MPEIHSEFRMGSAAIDFENYFASINPLASKIAQEKDCLISSLGDRWHEMTTSQQRWAEDHYFFGHAHEKEDSGEGEFDEELLQALRIRGGDRVIIDFDQESWTWRDEHSGPFSWMTRSQEDLSIDDIFSDKEPPKSPKLPQIATRLGKASADGGSSFIRNSPFVAADRGEVVSFKRDSVDENIFAKYGVSFGLNGEQVKDVENTLSTLPQAEHSDSKTETSSEYTSSEGSQRLYIQKRASLEDILQLGPEGIGLIKDRHYVQLGSASESHTPETMSFRSRESHTLDAGYRYPVDRDAATRPLAGSASELSFDSKASSPDVTPAQVLKLKKGKKWWSPKKEKTDSTNSLLNVRINSQKYEPQGDLGQLSPVFIEDPGESCDYEDTPVPGIEDDFVHIEMPSNLATLESEDPSIMPDATSADQTSNGTHGGFINPALSTTLEEEDWGATTLVQDSHKDDGSSDAVKTGFDFLDNW